MNEFETYKEVISFLAKRIADRMQGPHIAKILEDYKSEDNYSEAFDQVMGDECIEIDVFEEIMTILTERETSK